MSQADDLCAFTYNPLKLYPTFDFSHCLLMPSEIALPCHELSPSMNEMPLPPVLAPRSVYLLLFGLIKASDSHTGGHNINYIHTERSKLKAAA